MLRPVRRYNPLVSSGVVRQITVPAVVFLPQLFCAEALQVIKAQPVVVTITAWDTVGNVPKTGDVANITVKLVKDGVSCARNSSTAIAEVSATGNPGAISVPLDAIDTDANFIEVSGISSTNGVVVLPCRFSTERGALAAVQTSADTLTTRLSSSRAGYLDKLNVTGVLANSDAASAYKADVSSLATSSALTSVSSVLFSVSSKVESILEDTATTGVVVASSSKTGYALTTEYDSAKTAANQTSVDNIDSAVDSLGSSIASIDSNVDLILDDTGTSGVVVSSASKTGYALTTDYDLAKTAASQTSVNTLDSAVDALASAVSVIDSNVDLVLDDTGLSGVVVASASKTGYTLSSAGVQAIWEYSSRMLTTFGSLAADVAAAVWAVSTRTLSSFGNLITDIWANSARTLTDKTGFTISGTKTTLDAMHDLSGDDVRSSAASALSAYGPPTRADITADKEEILSALPEASPSAADVVNALQAAGTYLSSIKTVCDKFVFTTANKVDSSATVDEEALTSAVESAVGDLTTAISSIQSNLAKLYGTGSVQWTYTVYTEEDCTTPMSECKVWITDTAGNFVAGPQYTGADGVTTWLLNAGTYNIYRQRAGYTFTNPDVEVVSSG